MGGVLARLAAHNSNRLVQGAIAYFSPFHTSIAAARSSIASAGRLEQRDLVLALAALRLAAAKLEQVALDVLQAR